MGTSYPKGELRTRKLSHSIHIPDLKTRVPGSRFTWISVAPETHSLQRNDVNEDVYLSTTNKTYNEYKLVRLTYKLQARGAFGELYSVPPLKLLV